MKKGFRIHELDNVATLLADADEEEIQITGASLPGPIHCCQAIGLGHKIAVAEIEPNAPIIKYGVIIGTSTQPIRVGQWVHLHNCRSRFDQRSSSLDLHTGSSQDITYE
jgi:altronate dehydratase small subunit